MGSLAREFQRAVEVAVEWNAVAEKVVDAAGRLGGHAAGDLDVDEAGAGGDRVRHMVVDGVAGPERGGDAALGPGGGRRRRSARR